MQVKKVKVPEGLLKALEEVRLKKEEENSLKSIKNIYYDEDVSNETTNNIPKKERTSTFSKLKGIFYSESIPGCYDDEDEAEEIPKRDDIKYKKELNELPSIDNLLNNWDELIKSNENDIVNEITNVKLEPTFYDLIIKYSNKLNILDSDLYKKAQVDRRLFSKIRQGHKPNRMTVIRLGLALKLNIEEFSSLLNSCHYSLYDDNYFDVAIKYFINNKLYDIDECNDILYTCKLDLLTDYE